VAVSALVSQPADWQGDPEGVGGDGTYPLGQLLLQRCEEPLCALSQLPGS